MSMARRHSSMIIAVPTLVGPPVPALWECCAADADGSVVGRIQDFPAMPSARFMVRGQVCDDGTCAECSLPCEKRPRQYRIYGLRGSAQARHRYRGPKAANHVSVVYLLGAHREHFFLLTAYTQLTASSKWLSIETGPRPVAGR